MATDKEIREKLIGRGAKALSDSELLSIIIGDGPGDRSAAETAAALLENNTLLGLTAMDLRRLRMTEGLGIRRAAILSAALETARRIKAEEASEKNIIRGSDDITDLFHAQLSTLPHEEFWVVYLNSGNRILDRVRISQGGVSGTVVDHKLVVKRAIELLAPSLIMVHNHPSGMAAPSNEDISVTGKLVAAAALFDIAVLDHVIVTSGPSFSFRTEGLIK